MLLWGRGKITLQMAGHTRIGRVVLVASVNNLLGMSTYDFI